LLLRVNLLINIRGRDTMVSNETLGKILQPFIDESITSLKKMANLTAVPGEAFSDSVDEFRFKGYAVCTDITGDLDGIIMMHHYSETAISIANSVCESMSNEPYDYTEINSELGEALEEWGNTIVGLSTNLLGQQNFDFDFSTPYFLQTTDHIKKYLEEVVEIPTVPITIEGVGRYYFNILIRNINTTEDSKNGKSSQHTMGVINTQKNILALEKRILIVDDSALIRSLLKSCLNKLGYINIVEADDGLAAIEAIENDSPDFVFMDIVMKTMNGDEALRHIRNKGNMIPIVMLSSMNKTAVIQECLDYGVSGFILKPLQATDEGIQTIQNHLKVA